MRRLFALLAVIGMTLCGMPVLVDGAGDGTTRSSAAHARQQPITGAMVAQADNISIASDGTISLRRGPTGDFLQDLPVSLAGSAQDEPCVAAGPDGDFLVAWKDLRDDYGDVYAQRLDNKGNRIGPEIEVGAAAYVQGNPRAAFDSQGNIIVAWEDGRRQNDEVYAQRFDASGRRLGEEMHFVDSVGHLGFDCCAGPDGGFTIVYGVENNSATGSDLYAGRFDADGRRIGADIAVCTAVNSQWFPRLARLPSGSFRVAWVEYRNPSEYGLYTATIDSQAGVCSAGSLAMQSDRSVYEPVLQADRSGNCMVAFQQPTDKWDGYDVGAVWLDATSPGTANQLVVPGGLDIQGYPMVAAAACDRFMLCWQVEETYGVRVRLMATIFDPSSRTFGPVMPVGLGLWNETAPALAVDSCNGFLLAWRDGREAMASGIYARKYYYPAAPRGELVTADVAPRSLFRWMALEISQALQSRATNYLNINCSIDGGSSWVPLPANGSLAWAGNAPAIRVKAELGTYDFSTSPVILSMALNYTVNSPPAVSAQSPISTWRNRPLNVSVRGTDGDNDSLAYRWQQVEGPLLSGTNTEAPSLFVKADKPGGYRFRIAADDGRNLSAPCLVDLTVLNHAPYLTCPADRIYAPRGSIVRLKASATDIDGDRVQIIWSQKKGTPKLFEDWTGPELAFIALEPGEYRIQSIAYDGVNTSAPVVIPLVVEDPVAAAATEQMMVTAATLAASAIMVAAAGAYLFLQRRKNPAPPPEQ